MSENIYTVYAIEEGFSDFATVGFYTLERDAKEKVDALEKSGGIVAGSVGVNPMPMDALIEILVNERLGALAVMLREALTEVREPDIRFGYPVVDQPQPERRRQSQQNKSNQQTKPA